jgi:hypothetical protein
MHILRFPARMILVRVKAPTEHEMLAVLISILFGSNSLPNHPSQLPVGLIAAFIRGFDVLGVSLNARQGRPPLA